MSTADGIDIAIGIMKMKKKLSTTQGNAWDRILMQYGYTPDPRIDDSLPIVLEAQMRLKNNTATQCTNNSDTCVYCWINQEVLPQLTVGSFAHAYFKDNMKHK